MSDYRHDIYGMKNEETHEEVWTPDARTLYYIVRGKIRIAIKHKLSYSWSPLENASEVAFALAQEFGLERNEEYKCALEWKMYNECLAMFTKELDSIKNVSPEVCHWLTEAEPQSKQWIIPWTPPISYYNHFKDRSKEMK